MTQSSFPFSTALITGASSGIGRALALQVAQGGVRVALSARRQAELDALAEEIRRSGGDAVALPADLSRPEEAFRVVADAQKALGRLDLVVANAGVGKTGYLVKLSWEDIQQMLMVNTLGAMALIQAALPGMIRQGCGYIVGISSLASYRGMPTSAAYSSSKAALSTFLESVRIETRAQGIAVIDVHPGYIRTPMTSVNKGPMPFLMDADRAARLILRAIIRKKPVYDFPWQAKWFVRLIRMLPPAIFDRLASRSAPR
jgi:short-subunit dehydrogenase